jgi:hypothetical protein
MEQAQQSIGFVNQKNAPLQTAQGCGTQNSKSREGWPSLTHRIISHFKRWRTRHAKNHPQSLAHPPLKMSYPITSNAEYTCR